MHVSPHLRQVGKLFDDKLLKSSYPRLYVTHFLKQEAEISTMDFTLRQRHPSEDFTHVSVGKFVNESPETICILAASSCAVHLFGIETLGTEELIVPVASPLEVFGHVAQIACLPNAGGDLALVLLKTGELKVITCTHGR